MVWYFFQPHNRVLNLKSLLLAALFYYITNYFECLYEIGSTYLIVSTSSIALDLNPRVSNLLFNWDSSIINSANNDYNFMNWHQLNLVCLHEPCSTPPLSYIEKRVLKKKIKKKIKIKE